MKKQFLNWLPVVLISALALYACQKELSPTEIAGSTQQLSLYLSDDPARFDKVFIDIQKVEVMIDTCRGNDDDGPDNDDQCKAWYDLKVTAGVYDLLTLRNGQHSFGRMVMAIAQNAFMACYVALGIGFVQRGGEGFCFAQLFGIKQPHKRQLVCKRLTATILFTFLFRIRRADIRHQHRGSPHHGGFGRR
jgi:hypothetical protein